MKEIILSVGIDIGTSTTQLVFSKIHIENIASVATVPSIKIMDKELFYASEIYFTPLLSTTEIDVKELRSIVEREYKKANVCPEDLQTGAVIITGETARKNNANSVVHSLSDLAGEFVVATAGPALESIIAGKGAGAHTQSKKRGAVVVNLDIGGGTTNISVFHNGELLDTACLDIGGRLIRIEQGIVQYISPSAASIAKFHNVSLQVGMPAHLEDIQRVAEGMTHILEEALALREPSALLETIVTDKLLEHNYSIEYISFSGGVADCIKDMFPDNPYVFGDIGLLLGQNISLSEKFRQKHILVAEETIRATVLGASSHTTEISGSTIRFADDILPIHNIPILKLSTEEEALSLPEFAQIIAKKLNWFQSDENPALAFKAPKQASFQQIQDLADAIIVGMKRQIPSSEPLIIIIERDLGKALGQALQARLGQEKQVICIDKIRVENGDYIDIGKGLANGQVVPVIVKTLVFGA